MKIVKYYDRMGIILSYFSLAMKAVRIHQSGGLDAIVYEAML
jgi:hypothetical protein